MSEVLIDHLRVKRLWTMFDTWLDGNIYRGMTVKGLLKHKPTAEYIPESDQKRLKNAWNFSRTRFFYDMIMEGKDVDPIMVDNVCDGGYIHPQPVLIDGWHRLAAHHIAKIATIPAFYSGRMDLLDYLTGKAPRKPRS